MLDTIAEPEINHLQEIDTPTEITVSGVARCFHRINPGHRCNAPALRGEYFCRHHIQNVVRAAPDEARFDLPPITDRDSLRAAVLDIADRVAANSLDARRAGILLYSLRIALSTFPPQPRPKPLSVEEDDEPMDTSPEAGLVGAERARAVMDRLKRESEERRAEAVRAGKPDPWAVPLSPFDAPARPAILPAVQACAVEEANTIRARRPRKRMRARVGSQPSRSHPSLASICPRTVASEGQERYAAREHHVQRPLL